MSERYVDALPASQVQRERVAWLLPGRIPYGAVTLLVGDGGLGKSTWACWLAGETSRRDDVLVATAEDSLAATVRPRLEAVQADLGRVHLLRVRTKDSEEDGIVIPDDLPRLTERVKETEAKLLIIDPLVAHLAASLNTWSDHSVRRALSALHRLAEETGIAILAIVHINKSVSTDPAMRISGSSGFRNAARSMLVFGRDPDDDEGEGSARRLLAHSKSNYSALAPTLSYEIEPILLPAAGTNPEVATTRLVYTGESTVGHLDVLRRRDGTGGEGGSAIEEACEFLKDELAAGAASTKLVLANAKEVGISEITLRRAQRELGVRARKTDFGGGWEWHLPEDDQGGRPPSENADVDHLRDNGPTMRVCGPIDAAESPKVVNLSHMIILGDSGSENGVSAEGDDAEIAARFGVSEATLDTELERVRGLIGESPRQGLSGG